MSSDPRYEADALEASADVGLRITWADGHVSHYDAAAVRRSCPCATCNELRSRGRPVASDGPVHIVEASLAGAYAVSFGWSDGHSTGMYSWESLREGCPCDDCRSQRRMDGRANPLDP